MTLPGPLSLVAWVAGWPLMGSLYSGSSSGMLSVPSYQVTSQGGMLPLLGNLNWMVEAWG